MQPHVAPHRREDFPAIEVVAVASDVQQCESEPAPVGQVAEEAAEPTAQLLEAHLAGCSQERLEPLDVLVRELALEATEEGHLRAKESAGSKPNAISS